MRNYYLEIGTILRDDSHRWWKITQILPDSPPINSSYLIESLDYRRASDNSAISVMASLPFVHSVMKVATKAEQVLYGPQLK